MIPLPTWQYALHKVESSERTCRFTIYQVEPDLMGTPIKGVDVKMGRNPGGNAAARATTDAEGNFALPVVPQGSYTLTFTMPREAQAELSVKATVRGSAGEIFDSEVQFKVKLAVAPAPIILESDGQNPLTGICETTIVKSKSNISNN